MQKKYNAYFSFLKHKRDEKPQLLATFTVHVYELESVKKEMKAKSYDI